MGGGRAPPPDQRELLLQTAVCVRCEAWPVPSHLDGAFRAKGPLSVLAPAGWVPRASPGLEWAGWWDIRSPEQGCPGRLPGTMRCCAPVPPAGGLPARGRAAVQGIQLLRVSISHVCGSGPGGQPPLWQGCFSRRHTMSDPMSPGRVWERALLTVLGKGQEPTLGTALPEPALILTSAFPVAFAEGL